MKNGRWILYALCLPWTLTVSYPLMALFCLTRMVKDPRWSDSGVITAVWSDWVAARWQFSTTIGHMIAFYPGMREDTRVVRHEDVHVRQDEDGAFLGFLLFLLLAFFGHPWLGFFVWWSHGLWALLNFVTSGLRYGWDWYSMYRNSENERSAYAQTDVFRRKDPISWEDHQSGV